MVKNRYNQQKGGALSPNELTNSLVKEFSVYGLGSGEKISETDSDNELLSEQIKRDASNATISESDDCSR